MNGRVIAMVLVVSALSLVNGDRSLSRGSLYIMNSFLPPGDFCGPNKVMSGYTVIREVFQNTTSPLNMNSAKPGNFDPATGIFTAPFQGYYHVCGSARIKKGSHGDFTIVKSDGDVPIDASTDIQGAFGSVCPVQLDW